MPARSAAGEADGRAAGRGGRQRRARLDRTAALHRCAARQPGHRGGGAARAPWPDAGGRCLAAAVRAQCRRWGAAFVSRAARRAPTARRQRRGLGASRALSRAGRDGPGGRLQPRAAGAPPARPGRDLAAAGAARRRAGGAGGDAAARQCARHLAWARPWLDQPRQAIDAYVRRHRLRFVDDASNADPRFARNRLRTAVWPALLAAFPDAETTLAAAALRAQEAAALAAEVATPDLRTPCGEGAACASTPGRRCPRRGAATRCAPGLRGRWRRRVPESLVRAPVQRTAGRRHGRWPAPGGELRLHRGRAAVAMPLAAAPARGTGHDRPPPARRLAVAGLAWCASWCARRPRAASLPTLLRALRHASAKGGEQLSAAPRGTAAQPEEAVPGRGPGRLGSRTGRCSSRPPATCSSCPAWASTPGPGSTGEAQLDVVLGGR